jgi:hypothetical protein
MAGKLKRTEGKNIKYKIYGIGNINLQTTPKKNPREK